MRKSKRISMNLFDEELKSLINASAKIFPMSEDDIINNYNPNNYEYARVGRKIYIWINGSWEYVIADDIDIKWSDVDNKPSSFLPSYHTHNESDVSDLDKYSKSEIDSKLLDKSDVSHTHGELHTHNNKSVLDNITNVLVGTWNTVTGKSDIGHNHNKEDVVDFEHTHTEDDISDLDKYSKSEIDSKLSGKSDIVHNHDGAYYKKQDVDSKLNSKSNVGHTHSESDISDLDKYSKSEVDLKLSDKSDKAHAHSELHTHNNKLLLDKLVETESISEYDLSNLKYIEDIRGGYTEGHSHDNFTILQLITQSLVDAWNSAVTHVSDSIRHITSNERTLWNTVSNKSSIGHTHDYSPTNHTHDDRYYTEGEMDTKLGGKSDVEHTHNYALIDHNHDEVYYTETEVDNKLSAKSNTDHTHDNRYYIESEVDNLLASKAEKTTLNGHTNSSIIHVTQSDKNNWNEVTNKANISDIPNKTSDITNDSGFITMNDIPPPPPGFTVSTVKPTDGSMWFKEI